MKFKGLVVKVLTAVAVIALLVSCGASRGGVKTANRNGNDKTVKINHGSKKPQSDKFVLEKNLDKETKTLLSEAESWIGVPYLYGGNDRNGIDCSGFVLQVYLKALKISLPRTSRQQNEYCTSVKRERLQPGDLVFFDTKRKIDGTVSHVGLYVGDGNMIHASTSKGVILTSIDSDFYSSRFLGGGRVEPFYAMKKKSEKTDMLASGNSPKAPKTEKKKPAAETPKAAKPKPKTPKAEPRKQESPSPAVEPRPQNSGDARSLVLNSLIEEKIDSICQSSEQRR